MVESSPPTKNDEQYPLLMVSGGSGDGGRGLTPTVVPSGWNVHNCTPKGIWRDRWPEFVSACWVTFILLGISFLVFYVVGIIPYAQQSLFLAKCNNSKPASDVYYHHIVPHGSYPPFLVYSEYLSHVATRYQHLCFNVFFLIDDSFQSAFPASRHSGFYSKLMPYHPLKLQDEFNKREMRLFQRRFPNVNITVMPLSKYMAVTPLKFKWRSIPTTFLPFYARVFSVWENGGIGMDFPTFNNFYSNHQRPDKRIVEILKQHNNGLQLNGFEGIINKERPEKMNENEMILPFQDLIERILNETRSFINRTFPIYPATTEKDTLINEPLIRTHRNKRDTPEPANITEVNNGTLSVTNTTDVNFTKISVTNMTTRDLESNVSKIVLPDVLNDIIKTFESETPLQDQQDNDSSNMTDVHQGQIVLIYDLSIITDIGPPYQGPGPITPSDFVQIAPLTDSENKNPIKTKMGRLSQQLIIESEGLFVAATSRLHPLLGQLITAGCRRMHPKFAIKDALYTQCSSVFKDDIYCNNIYVL